MIMLKNMILVLRNKIYSSMKIILPFLLSISFISYALEEFNYNLFINSLKNANYFFILASVLLLIIIIFLRSLRWKLLFIKELKINDLYQSQLIGYMGNNIFPLRLGEILKAFFLEKKSKISKYEIIGTVILERVLDLIGLILLFLILLNFSIIEFLSTSYLKIIYLILIFVLISIMISFNLYRLKKYSFNSNFFKILRDVVSGFSIISKSNFLLSIFYTMLIWFSYILVVYLVQKSMYLNLTLIQCILLLFLSSLALIVPSLPGNIGTFEGSVVYTLLLFGIKDDFGFAFILHAVSFIPYTLLGLYYLIKERYLIINE